jgi:hypothetical protein
MSPDEDRARRLAEARAEAAELELERAHRLLDELGVPRDFRQPGERDQTDYSLLARMRILLDDLDG